MSTGKPRQIAVRALRRQAESGGFIETLLDDELSLAGMGGPDRAFAYELAFGVVRWQSTLDWLIARKTEGRVQKQSLQILLRAGLYQIFWLDRVPDHAAVNETVELAKELGCGRQAGFVNAMLRGYLREREPARQMLEDLKRDLPATGYSHPEWLVERWQARWSEEKLRRLLAWNNTPPILFARRNALRATTEQLVAAWTSEGVEFVAREWDWVEPGLVFELRSHPPFASLPSFQQGFFYVQDPSTLLAVTTLGPQPGESILDLCAAPGGKTTYIAQLMENRGYVMAQDLDVRRRELLRINCDRLGVQCVHLSRATSTVNLELSEPFDRILVDAPCSNTGVMRRRVDLRWRVQPAELERLRILQGELLHRAFLQLKRRGTLVYSTCSLEPEENSLVIQQFLNEHPACRLEVERELSPMADEVDGTYVACIKWVEG